jgi:hypothetical protein
VTRTPSRSSAPPTTTGTGRAFMLRDEEEGLDIEGILSVFVAMRTILSL